MQRTKTQGGPSDADREGGPGEKIHSMINASNINTRALRSARDFLSKVPGAMEGSS